jgi:5-methylthioribose kinase
MDISKDLSTSDMDQLIHRGWLAPETKLLAQGKAGEGNMNLVIRLETNRGNLILKQSKPFVVKYPQIAAPRERILVEYAYYQKIQDNPALVAHSPGIIGFDAIDYLMAMADLGPGRDFLGLYSKQVLLSGSQITLLTEYLKNLHAINPFPFPDNSILKALNHEHIFSYPFKVENGFDLDTIQAGLQSVALPYKKDLLLKKRISDLGHRYLTDGNTLVHGDFYPGSWLAVQDGLKIIDPEFAHVGDAEFDLAVLIAHLKMALLPGEQIAQVLKSYPAASLDHTLINQYTGVEIMRRLIGLAQLPLSLDLDQKHSLLEEARSLLLNE